MNPFRKAVLIFIGAQIVIGLVSSFYFPGVAFAIIPHESPVWTVLTAPVIHADWLHFVGNMEVFIPLVIILFIFYPRQAPGLYLLFYVLSSLTLWMIGSYGAHLGLSGVIIATAVYVVLAGFLSLEKDKLIIGVVTGTVYFSVLSQFYLEQPGVSIDAHVCGFLTGLGVVLVQHLARQSFPG